MFDAPKSKAKPPGAYSRLLFPATIVAVGFGVFALPSFGTAYAGNWGSLP